jgi:hypothetical protein
MLIIEKKAPVPAPIRKMFNVSMIFLKNGVKILLYKNNSNYDNSKLKTICCKSKNLSGLILTVVILTIQNDTKKSPS